MKDWQKRLIVERDELAVRVDKLSEFVMEEGGVYDTLPREEQVILCAQLGYMGAYWEILEDRCAEF